MKKSRAMLLSHKSVNLYNMESVAKQESSEPSECVSGVSWTSFPDSVKREAEGISYPDLVAASKSSTGEAHEYTTSLILAKIEKYIYRVIHTYYSTYCPYHTSDLFDSGVVGVMKALDGNYDPSFAFTTYVINYIRHEMSDYVHYLNGNQTVHYANIDKKIRKAENKLIASGLPATAIMIAYEADLKPELVEKELAVMHRKDHVMIDNEDESVREISSYTDSPETLVIEQENKELLDKAINNLPEESDKLIVRMKNGLVNGACLEIIDVKASSSSVIPKSMVADEYFEKLKDDQPKDSILVPEEGLKNKEIALILGLSESQVKAKYNTSISRLRVSPFLRPNYNSVLKKGKAIMDNLEISVVKPIDLDQEMEDLLNAIECTDSKKESV